MRSTYHRNTMSTVMGLALGNTKNCRWDFAPGSPETRQLIQLRVLWQTEQSGNYQKYFSDPHGQMHQTESTHPGLFFSSNLMFNRYLNTWPILPPPQDLAWTHAVYTAAHAGAWPAPSRIWPEPPGTARSASRTLSQAASEPNPGSAPPWFTAVTARSPWAAPNHFPERRE